MWLQKVRQAPARKLFVACRCHKRRRTTSALPDFCASVTDKEMFRRRLSHSVQARAALVGDGSQSAVMLSTLTHPLSQPLNRSLAQALIAAVSGDPCLGRDFQVWERTTTTITTITTTTITTTTITTTPARDLHPGRASARTHFIDD